MARVIRLNCAECERFCYLQYETMALDWKNLAYPKYCPMTGEKVNFEINETLSGV